MIIIHLCSRAVVVHSGEDDYGLGGTPLSNTTGNSGERVGCGVIGCKLFPLFNHISLIRIFF